jgi:predicted TIM-barrel fold metal-dependent hydrolase
MYVDTHFHIFDRNTIDPGATRYSVNYSASLSTWSSLSRSHNITHGVIIQPSFLGANNAFLLDAIAQFPDQLKGVGVVDAAISKDALQALKNQGICGVRLNLSEDPNPLRTIDNNQALLEHLYDLDMHLQIHHDDGLLNTLLLNIPRGLKIVIDHFGRPKSNIEFLADHLGIEHHQPNLWVKLSAPYRTPNLDHQSIYKFWLNKIGPSRLLWGSDWPHTRHEAEENFAEQMQQFFSLTNNQNIKDQILNYNPMALYWS